MEIKYFLSFPRIYYDSDVVALVDGKYKIRVKCHTSTSMAILNNTPSFEELIFYTDCISYVHDVPGFFYPPIQKQNKAIIQPIIRFQKLKNISEENDFNKALEIIYSILVDIKINAYVCFKWEDAYFETINIPLTEMYSFASKEINLYSMALKQLDPLTEFLCYYRVIESVAQDQGISHKKWIENNIGRLKDYNFGFLEIYDSEGEFFDSIMNKERTRRKNLFSYYRRRAINRISKLRQKLPANIDIVKHLYKETRCGIAHGRDIIKYDYKYNLKEVALDVYIIKLLARMAIEDKLKSK